MAVVADSVSISAVLARQVSPFMQLMDLTALPIQELRDFITDTPQLGNVRPSPVLTTLLLFPAITAPRASRRCVSLPA